MTATVRRGTLRQRGAVATPRRSGRQSDCRGSAPGRRESVQGRIDFAEIRSHQRRSVPPRDINRHEPARQLHSSHAKRRLSLTARTRAQERARVQPVQVSRATHVTGQ